MNNMFFGCTSLISLPDISKWNTSSVTDMSAMFGRCHSLIFVPDISKWDNSKVINKELMFYESLNILNIYP